MNRAVTPLVFNLGWREGLERVDEGVPNRVPQQVPPFDLMGRVGARSRNPE